MMAPMMGMKAAVGPYTWYLEPPNSDPSSTAMAPGTMPCSGRKPDAMAMPMPRGMATAATTRPAVTSRKPFNATLPANKSS